MFNALQKDEDRYSQPRESDSGTVFTYGRPRCRHLLRPDWSAVHAVLFQKTARTAQLFRALVRSQAYAVPDTFVGDRRGLNAGFDTQQGKPGLEFFGIINLGERPRLQKMRFIGDSWPDVRSSDVRRPAVGRPGIRRFGFVGALDRCGDSRLLFIGQHLVEFKTGLASGAARSRRWRCRSRYRGFRGHGRLRGICRGIDRYLLLLQKRAG